MMLLAILPVYFRPNCPSSTRPVGLGMWKKKWMHGTGVGSCMCCRKVWLMLIGEDVDCHQIPPHRCPSIIVHVLQRYYVNSAILKDGTLHIISSNSPQQYFSLSAMLIANKKQLSCTANLHSPCSSDQSLEERSRSQETVPASWIFPWHFPPCQQVSLEATADSRSDVTASEVPLLSLLFRECCPHVIHFVSFICLCCLSHLRGVMPFCLWNVEASSMKKMGDAKDVNAVVWCYFSWRHQQRAYYKEELCELCRSRRRNRCKLQNPMSGSPLLTRSALYLPVYQIDQQY